jgi:hypothetical protein
VIWDTRTVARIDAALLETAADTAPDMDGER